MTACAFWIIAMLVSNRKQELYDDHAFEKFKKHKSGEESSPEGTEEDEMLLLQDIKAINAFARILRFIGVGCFVAGLFMFGIR